MAIFCSYSVVAHADSGRILELLEQYSRRLELVSASMLTAVNPDQPQELSPIGQVFLQGEAPLQSKVRPLKEELQFASSRQTDSLRSSGLQLQTYGPDLLNNEPHFESTAVSDYLRAAHNVLLLGLRQRRWRSSVDELIKQAKDSRNFERRLDEIGFDDEGRLRLGPHDHRDRLPITSDIIFRKINQLIVNASEPFRNLTQTDNENWTHTQLETILESRVISEREKLRLAEALTYYVRDFIHSYDSILSQLDELGFSPELLSRHLNWHQIVPTLSKIAIFTIRLGVTEAPSCTDLTGEGPKKIIE